MRAKDAQERTGVLEKRHFYKHFMHDIQKKGSAGKHFSFFFQNTFQTTFQMKILRIDTHKQGYVFQNQGSIFLFSKKIRDTYSSPLLVARLT